jgi:hypothetical protein
LLTKQGVVIAKQKMLCFPCFVVVACFVNEANEAKLRNEVALLRDLLRLSEALLSTKFLAAFLCAAPAADKVERTALLLKKYPLLLPLLSLFELPISREWV